MLDRMQTEANLSTEQAALLEPMRRAVNCRYRELVRETLGEYQRRGNYIRIYPAKGCDMYDGYFSGPRPYNKAVYRALFSEDVMKASGVVNPPKPLAVEKPKPETAYDNYKKQ